MSLKVIGRAPEVRCYQCGSADIRSVCHHCSRPMCAEHGSVVVRERATNSPAGPAAISPPSGLSASRVPGSPGTPAEEEPDGPDTKPTSREFAGLKLLPVQAAVHHCEDHDHTVGVVRAGFTAASSMLGFGQSPAQEPPPLPVFPNVNTASVVERLTGEVQLTDTDYVSAPQPVEGRIVIGMTHARARWQETMGRYRRRHQLPENYPVKFAAGFAMLRGKAGLTFDAGQDAIAPGGLGLVFQGALDGHDLFDTKRGRPQGEWELSVGYQLQPARAPRDIPLWIVPSLGATSDKRVLMIDLHWNMPEVDGSRAELNQFELIEFQVPHQWGSLEHSSPPGAASSAPKPGQPRVIQWRQHRPAPDERRRRSGSATAPRSMTLTMEFEKPILDQPLLSGSLRATFNRTLSGVTGIDFYLAGGGPVRHLDVKPRTEVSVRFSISLGSLRYQERRAVPDHSRATGEDEFRPKSDEFSGVMPDEHTVIELTNAISADGYYVKTVVEDHPHHVARDKTFKRGWDITGRWYEGVFPINFIISLRGTEPEDSVAGSALSRTVAQVTVDGTFPNAEMKRRIEDKWDGLHARVTGLLAARASRIGDPGPNVTHGLLTDSRSEIAPAPGPGDSSGEIVVPGEVIGEGEGEGETHREAPGLAAELQRQRNALRTLLAESDLISERTCREAIEDIRAELRYLEQPDELLGTPGDRETEIKVAALLRQRRGWRGKLIAGRLSEDFYSDEVADITADLKNLGWSQ